MTEVILSMAKHDARRLELTLLEGRFDGPQRVRLPRRTYSVYLVPASSFDAWRCDKKMNQPGVYMLLEDPSADNPRLYIGKADLRANGKGALSRVIEHRDQGRHRWCHTAVLLVDEPKNFTATELKFLESHLIRMAREAGRNSPENIDTPSAGDVEDDVYNDLRVVLADARLMIASMRMLFLEPPLAGSESGSDIDPVSAATEPARAASSTELFMRLRGSTEPAVLVHSAGSWVLKAGSTIKGECTDRRIGRIRSVHAAAVDGERTTAAISFTSASAAASFVSGNPRNGNLSWADAEGTSLGDLKDSGAFA